MRHCVVVVVVVAAVLECAARGGCSTECQRVEGWASASASDRVAELVVAVLTALAVGWATPE